MKNDKIREEVKIFIEEYKMLKIGDKVLFNLSVRKNTKVYHQQIIWL